MDRHNTMTRKVTSKKRSGTNLSAVRQVKPKRFRTAYNFFFQRERAKILGLEHSIPKFPVVLCKRKHIKTHGKIGFQDLVRKISQKWNQLDTITKSVFQKMHEEDKRRYERETAEYNTELIEGVQRIFARGGENEYGTHDDYSKRAHESELRTQSLTANYQSATFKTFVGSPQRIGHSFIDNEKIISEPLHDMKGTSSVIIESYLIDARNCGGDEVPFFPKKNAEGLTSTKLTEAELDLKKTLGDDVIDYLANMKG